jgi:fructose 1,6-bisphosphate aldolase/phosphatase
MKITLSAIKADIDSVGGHICPSETLLKRVQEFINQNSKEVLIDFQISHTGDDIAILCTHKLGVGSEKVHKLAWDTFVAGTEVAKEQGLYGAGQELLL